MTVSKELDFEKRLKRLQTVVDQLEQGDLPLEKGVALYKEGLALAKACREQLQAARNEIETFGRNGLEPFEPEPDVASEQGEDGDDGHGDA